MCIHIRQDLVLHLMLQIQQWLRAPAETKAHVINNGVDRVVLQRMQASAIIQLLLPIRHQILEYLSIK